MNAEFEELTLKLNQANAKIDALQTIVALLLGWEGKSNPLVLTSLRMLAAGDVPELMPDLSTIPSNFTPAQRAHVEADLAKHRKATKVAIMELATTYSLLLGEAKRGYPNSTSRGQCAWLGPSQHARRSDIRRRGDPGR